MTRTVAQIAALLASGTVLCGSSWADRGPTYNREVSRILLKHCVGCHHNGGVGPFPLTTYSEASAFAREIRRATQTRKMPPWAAVSGYGEFQNQRLLTIGEIKTLGEWFDKGAQEGEASCTGRDIHTQGRFRRAICARHLTTRLSVAAVPQL